MDNKYLHSLLNQFPNTEKVNINGADKDIPQLTEENFWTLLSSHNQLIEKYNHAIFSLNLEIKELKSQINKSSK
jgi:hypothetical protein